MRLRQNCLLETVKSIFIDSSRVYLRPSEGEFENNNKYYNNPEAEV